MNTPRTFSHRFLIAALVGIGFIFLMLGNGLISLTHPDEVFYTQTAREMVSQKNWFTPKIFNSPQFEKPIFFYWLLAIGVKFFGPVPFVARFWPSLFAILGIIVVYWFSWMLFASRRLSFLAGLILCTSLIYLGMARAVLTDMVFSFWIMAALAFFYWAYSCRQDQWKKEAGIILFFACAGMAVLTKGLLGICFPLTIVHFYLRYKKDLAFLNGRAGIIGLCVFWGIAVPWHLEMYRLYGQAFIDEYWYNVHIRRIFEAEHRRLDTWHFYPSVIFGGTMPWTFFLFPALFLAGKKIIGKDQRHCSQFSFLAFWIFVILVIQQIAKSKLASYILPIFPAFAIIIAYYLDQVASEAKKGSFRIGFVTGGYILALALTLIAAAAVVAGYKYIDIIPSLFPVYVLAALFVLCSFGIVISLIRQRFAGVIAGAVNFVLSLLIVFTLVHKVLEPWVSCQDIANVLKQSDTSDSTVMVNKSMVRAVYFYTGRKVAVIEGPGKGFFSPHPIPILDEEAEIRAFLRSQPVTYAILRKGMLEIVEGIVGQGPHKIIIIAHIADKYLLKIEQLNSQF